MGAGHGLAAMVSALTTPCGRVLTVRRILFTQLTQDDLASLVKLEDHRIRPEPWEELAHGDLTKTEQRIIDHAIGG